MRSSRTREKRAGKPCRLRVAPARHACRTSLNQYTQLRSPQNGAMKINIGKVATWPAQIASFDLKLIVSPFYYLYDSLGLVRSCCRHRARYLVVVSNSNPVMGNNASVGRRLCIGLIW